MIRILFLLIPIACTSEKQQDTPQNKSQCSGNVQCVAQYSRNSENSTSSSRNQKTTTSGERTNSNNTQTRNGDRVSNENIDVNEDLINTNTDDIDADDIEEKDISISDSSPMNTNLWVNTTGQASTNVSGTNLPPLSGSHSQNNMPNASIPQGSDMSLAVSEEQNAVVIEAQVERAPAEEKVAPRTPAITNAGIQDLSIMMLKLPTSSCSVAERATQ